MTGRGSYIVVNFSKMMVSYQTTVYSITRFCILGQPCEAADHHSNSGAIKSCRAYIYTVSAGG
jgi:hypothetical protein